jgi:hypothetical protein
MNKLIPLIAGLIVAYLPGTTLAEQSFLSDLARDKVLSWQFSPYSYHFSQDPDHEPVVMVGIERAYPNAKVDGFALFTNSFGQPTIYVYPWGGTYKSIAGIEHLTFKWTAGLMFGYREPYEDKVPLNYKGLSPVVIPALVYEFKPGWSGQLNILGTAGVMFQLNAPFN